MKNYMKPQMIKKDLSFKENVSSLNDWLMDNNLEDAGITTYIVNS